jgi:hypothetical protein
METKLPGFEAGVDYDTQQAVLSTHDRFVHTVDQLRQAARNAIDVYGAELANWRRVFEPEFDLVWEPTALYPSDGQGARYQIALDYHDRSYAAYCALAESYSRGGRFDTAPRSVGSQS